MYLVYVDESGQATYKEPSDYVLGTVIIHESKWQQVDNLVTQLKLNYFPDLEPSEIELHAYEIFGRKRMFRLLNKDTRRSLILDIAQLIASSEITLLAVVFEKHRALHKPDITTWSYRLLLERLCFFLDKENKNRLEQGKPLEYGIMMIDSIHEKFDVKIRKVIKRLLKENTHRMANSYLIEDPLFVKSHFRSISQLADFVAFIVRAYFDVKRPINEKKLHRSLTNEFRDEVVMSAFQLIEHKFDRDIDGSLYGSGIKLFPE